MITKVTKANADKYSFLYEKATEYLMTHDADGNKLGADEKGGPDAILQYLRSPDKAMFDRVVQGEKDKRKKQFVKQIRGDLGKIVNAKAVTNVSHTGSVSKVKTSKKIKHI